MQPGERTTRQTALRASAPPHKVPHYEVPCEQAEAGTPDQLGWGSLLKESASPVYFSGAAAALWTPSLSGVGVQTSLGVPVPQSRGEGPENIALRRQYSQVSVIVQCSNLSSCTLHWGLCPRTVPGARLPGFTSRLCALPGQVPSHLGCSFLTCGMGLTASFTGLW